MPIWTDDRRLIYFICVFPVGIMSLLPFPSIALDFLIIFSLVWTGTYLAFAHIPEKAPQNRGLLFMGFSSIGLRLIVMGVAMRKLVVQGPEFDGQVLRSIGELFRNLNFEAHVIFCIFLIFCLAIIIKLIGREISTTMRAYLDLATSGLTESDLIAAGKAAVKHREDDEQAYRISDFFSKVSVFETKAILIFLVFTAAAAIHFRDRLLPVSIEKSMHTSAIMTLSLLVYYVPLKLLDIAALCGWMRRLTGKPVGHINLRYWIFENRFRLIVVGSLLIAISFVPDFPRVFLVIVSAVSFSAGFLSDVLETHNKAVKIEENLIANDLPSAAAGGHQATLLLGRDVWNDFYVQREQELQAALDHIRLQVIKESGIVFGEINIVFSQRLRPDSAAVLLNGERVSKTSLESALRGHAENDPSEGNTNGQLFKLVCDYVHATLRHYVPCLSHDPAVVHLVRNFEF